MLLCDTAGCFNGQHLYCLVGQAKLATPEGPWHCDKCRAKEEHKPAGRRKRLREF